MNICSRLKLSSSPHSVFWRKFRYDPSPMVIQTTPSESITKKKRAKQLIVNTKYDECSDPIYRHLLYSSEMDVFLTVKRGKVWLERMYAQNMAMKRDLHERQLHANNPSVPVALQYLYGGSAVVQGEEDVHSAESYEATTIPVIDDTRESEESYNISSEDNNSVSFPYGIYNDLNQINVTESNSGEPKLGRRRMRRRAPRKSAVEHDDLSSEDYDVIRNDLVDPEIRTKFSEDHLFKYGTPDPEVSSSNVPCGGCGAVLHCRDEKIPGYIPSQLMQDKDDESLRRTLCQRCYFIQEYNIALKVAVSPEDYPKAIEHLKDKPALILLVVDLLDFPGSIWPNILDLLGKNKKIILVGNKVDLLLPDQANYIKNVTDTIREEFLKKCFSNAEGKVFPKLISSICVSARTGFNIERLIDKIFRYWRWNNNSLPGDIYIVGCTNVGKSSVFNALLDSDLCKIRAVDLVAKAVTSPVPGTTLSLLKFPVTRPEPHFINDRGVRIRQADMAFTEKERERLENLRKSKKVELAVPSTYSITHTLINTLKERQPLSGYLPETQVAKPNLPEVLDPKSEHFSLGKWCYDTPGTVSEDQVINLLTAEEISKTLPTSPLIPRTILLRVGHTLLVGGLGRLDYVEGLDLPPVSATVFCSQLLPINVVETEGVEEFLRNSALTKLTAVPEGGIERMRKFPPLLGQEVRVKGVNWRIGSQDIVLSSAGWVMITNKMDQECMFIAYTPGGKGIVVRKPFLPLSVNQKGKRILGSPTYRNDKLFLKEINW